jgi:hypothetical protein
LVLQRQNGMFRRRQVCREVLDICGLNLHKEYPHTQDDDERQFMDPEGMPFTSLIAWLEKRLVDSLRFH